MTKRKADSLGDGWSDCSSTESKVPFFISHLLAPERKHDCYFLYGPKPGNSIGAVKLMLLAHSAYFRNCLREERTGEPEVISVLDLSPPILKNLLRYIYGYNNTSTLTFGEANGLLYAADKFLMDSLRDVLIVHLTSLLSYENICTLLNNPVCSNMLSLQSSVNKILQYETEKVLASPSFVNLNVDAFVRILSQDSLMVPEIELWRAALKWAKKQANTSEGRALRTRLTFPLQHIRLCSMSPFDLCKEVVPTGVLSDQEVRMVVTSVGTGEKQSGLTMICNETKCRSNPVQYEMSQTFEETFPGFTHKSRTKVMSLRIITKECPLELLPFEFTAKQSSNMDSATYECSCTIQILNELSESTTYVGFSQHIRYGEPFMVPIQSKGENVRLLPNNEYMVKINFTQPIWYYATFLSPSFSSQYFEARFPLQKGGWYLSPIKKLSYKITHPVIMS